MVLSSSTLQANGRFATTTEAVTCCVNTPPVMNQKPNHAIQIFPTDRKGWWRFAFYTFETIVVCMTIRQKNLNERSLGHANYSLTFHIIWLLAMLMLLTVSIVI